MMVDETYYADTYLGKVTVNFDKYNLRASDLIYSRLNLFDEPEDLSDFDDVTITLIKKAICAQIDYLANNGETYNNDDTNFSLGNFSKSDDATSNSIICTTAQGYLNSVYIGSCIARFG